MSVIIFLLVLSLLIFVHELGHFIAAKKSGVKVHEFALGFPPTLFKKKVGETVYKLNALPFGGYVNLEGENGEEDPSSAKDEQIDKPEGDVTAKDSFSSKGPVTKTVILAAGVVMNMLLAWLLLSICFMVGYPTVNTEGINPKYVTDERVIVAETVPNAPAAEAGLLAGDVILSIDDESRSVDITSAALVGEFIRSTEDDSVTITVNRDGEERSFEVLTTTELSEEIDEGDTEKRKMVGISPSDISMVKLPPHIALVEGAVWTYELTGQVIVGLGTLIADAVRGTADMSGVAGPIGIVSLVGEAYSVGFIYLLSFTAVISINLAIINLLPIPALDGGRILFTWIEVIKGSPMKMKTQLIANGIGFALLILLMIFISVNDIINLFK